METEGERTTGNKDHLEIFKSTTSREEKTVSLIQLKGKLQDPQMLRGKITLDK